MIKVVFVIRQFVHGGAERQLVELLRHIDKDRFAPTVICLYPGGGLWDEVRQIPHVTVWDLGKASRWDMAPVWRLAGALRRVRPHAVHGYMDVANILALSGKLTGARVIWGIRASRMDLRRYDWLHRVAQKIETLFSAAADLIICNSEAGKLHAIERGVAPERLRVIPNGIDTTRFRPDEQARARVRAEWRVADNARLVGIPARFDPMKGHTVFIDAAREVARRFPDARFVCIGGGPQHIREALQRHVTQVGLDARFIWAGERNDIASVLPALDLVVSASLFGEGFSNALAEAMACGVPCVATDVGDSAAILARLGWVVPPDDASALGSAICEALQAIEAGHVARSHVLRAHIESNFSVRQLAEKTEAALLSLIGEAQCLQR